MITAKFMRIEYYKFINNLANIVFGSIGAIILVLFLLALNRGADLETIITIGVGGVVQIMATVIWNFIMSHTTVYTPKQNNGGNQQ